MEEVDLAEEAAVELVEDDEEEVTRFWAEASYWKAARDKAAAAVATKIMILFMTRLFLFVNIIFFCESPEFFDIFHPEIPDIIDFQSPCETLSDIIRAADLVEHSISCRTGERIVLRIQLLKGLHHVKLGQSDDCRFVVGVIVLNPVEKLSGLTPGEGGEMDRAENCPFDAIAVMFRLESVGIYPFGCENLKRKGVADTYVEVVVELADKAGGRIADRRAHIRYVRGRGDPREIRILIYHTAAPSAHRDDGELAPESGLVALLAAVEAFLVDEAGQLPYRETVNIRNAEFADKGEKTFLDARTLDFEAAERVRAV